MTEVNRSVIDNAFGGLKLARDGDCLIFKVYCFISTCRCCTQILLTDTPSFLLCRLQLGRCVMRYYVKIIRQYLLQF